AGHSPDGEDYGEHVRGNANSPHDDSAVEIDVGIELSLDEVLVRERLLLELPRDVEKGVLDAKLGKHLVGGSLEYPRARVEVLVDAMTEAHQPEAALGLFRQLDRMVGRHPSVVDLLKHVKNRDIGSAMEWTPEGTDRRRARGE